VTDLTTYAAALAGDDERLRAEAGQDAVICVAPRLRGVFVVKDIGDGRQEGALATVGAPDSGHVAVVQVPRTFRVREITADRGEFVLTAADGRTVRGTPGMFTSYPMLVDPSVNPRYDEQLEDVYANLHRITDLFTTVADPRSTDRELSGPEVDEIVRDGEAVVRTGDGEQVWLKFQNAWPERVAELLPRAREVLAALERIAGDGAEFLWSKTRTGEETAEEKDEFLGLMTPSSLVMYITGDFEIHYEGVSGVYYLDGYWPSVHFLADGTPVDHAMEA
jgi:hypothetical protein